jgi:hypothetical protein
MDQHIFIYDHRRRSLPRVSCYDSPYRGSVTDASLSSYGGWINRPPHAVWAPLELRRSRLKLGRGGARQSAISESAHWKVCKRDGEGTFAGSRGNDRVAPIPAVRGIEIERQGSTLKNHS